MKQQMLNNQLNLDTIAEIESLGDLDASNYCGGFQLRENVGFDGTGEGGFFVTVNESGSAFGDERQSKPGQFIDLSSGETNARLVTGIEGAGGTGTKKSPAGIGSVTDLNDDVSVVEVVEGELILATVGRLGNSREGIILPPGKHNLTTKFNGRYNDTLTGFVNIA